MTIEQLRCFDAVCRHRSITAAADELFISKQAMSANILRIEQEMKTPLLIRRHSGISPTPAGERFLTHARTILARWHECLADMAPFGCTGKPLRIGMAFQARNLWTPAAAREFNSLNPDIPQSVSGGFVSDLLPAMDAGDLDCVITYLRREYADRYDSLALCDSPLTFFMSDRDPLAGRDTLRPADLDGRNLVFHQSGASLLYQLIAWLESQGAHVNPVLYPGGGLAQEQTMIRECGGLSLRNAVYFAAEPNALGYTTRRSNREAFAGAPPCTISLVYPKGTSPSPEMLRFADFLRSYLQTLM